MMIVMVLRRGRRRVYGTQAWTKAGMTARKSKKEGPLGVVAVVVVVVVVVCGHTIIELSCFSGPILKPTCFVSCGPVLKPYIFVGLY